MELTQDRLKELLHYSADTGIFTWRVSRGCRKAGSVAGTTPQSPKEYCQIQVEGVQRDAHRLAYFYVYGEWPVEIDHEYRDRSDNRIRGLRNVTHLENQRNLPMLSTNTSGVTGVRKAGKRWRAYIGIGGKTKELGTFKLFEKAKAVRLAAEVAFGYHPNHGK